MTDDPPRMTRPAELASEGYRPWSRGKGTQVWEMFRAADRGDLATLSRLISENPLLVTCEFEYRKPLHFAVRANQLAAAKYLLEHGADATYVSGSRMHEGPITIARDRGYVEMERLLAEWLEERFGTNARGEELALLIKERRRDEVLDRLQREPDLVHFADGRGNQPLHWAVMTRQLPLIDALLDLGAGINRRRADGARPIDLTNGDYWYRGWQHLPKTALGPHEVLIGYLLGRGAEYDIITACTIGDLERVSEILKSDPGLAKRVPAYSTYYSGAPLRVAAKGGHSALVALLLEHGANPNEPEEVAPWGGALYEAIAGGHLEVAKLLLKHGANPNSAVESSGDCMSRARGKGEEWLQLLRESGGEFSLHMCCWDGDIDTIRARLERDPALEFNDECLNYIIHHENRPLLDLLLQVQPELLKGRRLPAAKTVEFARFLLGLGMDPAKLNWLGVTPLHAFAGDNNLAMAELALEHGADLEALDHEYESTPLGWAARRGQLEMVEFLLKAGASREHPQGQAWATPAAWARRRGHDQVLSSLAA